MGILRKPIVLLIVAALAGGVWLLATWDIPVPAEPLEIPIPDDRLPR